MKKVQGLCERNQINRCLCHDKEVAEFPFDLRTFYFDCRPTKVSAPLRALDKSNSRIHQMHFPPSVSERESLLTRNHKI